jgi:exosortase E/protease (VPEID-CTERM system)
LADLRRSRVSSVPTTSSAFAPVAWPFWPQTALAILLILEILTLTTRFDTERLGGVHSVWAVLIGWSPQYLRLATSIVLAILLVAGARLIAIVRRHETRGLGSSAPFFLAHIGSLAVFAALTSTIMENDFSALGHPSAWSLAWLLSGLATLIAWGLALFPPHLWSEFVTEESARLVAGVALGSAVWGSGFVTEGLWRPLSRYTFAIVHGVLGLTYPQVLSDPASMRIGTPSFTVIIAPECSGYEGIGLIVAFLSAYLWLCRNELRFPAALMLLPIGAASIWILNALRIAALIAIGTAGWRAVALGGFHSQAGWLTFNIVGLGFVALTERAGFFRVPLSTSTSTQSVATHESHQSNPAAAYLGPLVAILAVGMVTGAVSAGFDWWYPLRVVAVLLALWLFRAEYRSLRWTMSWWALGVGSLTFCLWLALIPHGVNDKDAWPAALQSVSWYWASGWMLFRVVGYLITAPVAEELAFRGFLTRRLIGTTFEDVPMGTFTWISFLGSSILFGVFHGGLWLPGTLAGMSFAVALYQRRALGDAVLAHVTTNGLLAIYAVASGHWSVWS